VLLVTLAIVTVEPSQWRNSNRQISQVLSTPKMQTLIGAFVHAVGTVPAFQQPAAPANPPPVASVSHQFPANAITLPTFHGTVQEPVDSKRKVKCSPASVVSCL
jgi:hypothetical protein